MPHTQCSPLWPQQLRNRIAHLFLETMHSNFASLLINSMILGARAHTPTFRPLLWKQPNCQNTTESGKTAIQSWL
jgi:hypothetical protein